MGVAREAPKLPNKQTLTASVVLSECGPPRRRGLGRKVWRRGRVAIDERREEMHRRKLWLFAGGVLAALALAATGSGRGSGAGRGQGEKGRPPGVGAGAGRGA